MQNYGKVRWLSVVLLLFTITYITYLFEKDSIARITAEILVGKKYTNEMLQKVVFDATSNNDSIIKPIKTDIENLQSTLRSELYRAKITRDSLFCILEDQNNQLSELRKDLDSVQSARNSFTSNQDSLYVLYNRLSSSVVKMKLTNIFQREQPKTLLDSMRVVFIPGENKKTPLNSMKAFYVPGENTPKFIFTENQTTPEKTNKH